MASNTVNLTQITRNARASRAAIANEQAHAGRMADFETLLQAYSDGLELHAIGEISGPELTRRRTELRGYVQVMSRRLKLKVVKS